MSVGHRVSIESAIELVNECCKNRVPEPIRMADKISRRIIDKYNEEYLSELEKGGEKKDLQFKDEKLSVVKEKNIEEQIQEDKQRLSNEDEFPAH